MSKIVVDQVFLDEKYTKFVLRREYNCNLVPIAEMEIYDKAWEKPKKIKKVVIDPSKDEYIIFVNDEFVTSKTVKKTLETYINLGWKEL
ncbi:MAG: hypothetical protein WHW07_01465 [Bacteroidales bacterium]|jgi:succinyl-CoA synthetase beta subunit|nr:hypothetical protein [Bacteroidales bacterium]HOL97327.1 hypothetical protein [Bacteroidales bacterium]HOM36952.1 hypothetical protein [Bacteroidales bacterium]HPD22893.1 hypothetical protein [Bacteroidales bacterium]HRS98560.1 hypothetical protein [Bacteroidales bacterium]